MEQLPSITWTEFATKRDLEQSRHSLEKSLMEVQHSVETLKFEPTATMEHGFRNQSWKMFTAILTSQLVTVGLLGLMINSLR